MATLCIYHQFIIRNSLIHRSNLLPTKIKNFRSMICLSRLPMDQMGQDSTRNDEKEKGSSKEENFLQIFQRVEKMGKGWLLKEDYLKPKQNGDWKDIMLMSISFAVYVYISQKIVCAYCAWVAMVNQPW